MTSLHRAIIHWSDGGSDQLFSADGWWFYRHWPRRPDDRPYERQWLEEIAPGQPSVARVQLLDQEVPVEAGQGDGPRRARFRASVVYADGSRSHFYSLDGIWFYEHRLPASATAQRFERSWLQLAVRSGQVSSISFEEWPGGSPDS